MVFDSGKGNQYETATGQNRINVNRVFNFLLKCLFTFTVLLSFYL